ncbi:MULTISPECIES: SagB/ThcOx family dehydrogenase [Bacillus cereus group]|uniref:SagB/ThcOx family dehydrogenase n=1 Tax=Bacillus cereus group TaxID=86661 RepID=UPI001CFCDD06|nr:MULTISPECIES: SagB/ThcOx family dehydrogenase [Bacillus cereus group]USK97373.1 SagB/ThcOx family dehydrogenase [Bacillus tropicus]WHT85051.1 SagB/ThcOx family dehydrogenase [Bacillus cereus]WHT90190.1 SagB/ThcOx family dehydrogenase [Bacillus cereus]
MKSEFFDYELLYHYIKHFEPRRDGWNETHKPHEPYSFPTFQEKEGSIKVECTDTLQKLSNIYQTIHNRKTTLSEQFKNSWHVEELMGVLNLGIGTNGSTRQLNEYYNNHKIHLRNYPSAGAMYSVEPYFYSNGVEGLEDGFYKYQGDYNSIYKVQNASSLIELQELFPILINEHVKIIVFFIANLKYTFPKYGFYSYQLSLIESGHMAQNLILASTEIKKSNLPAGGFYSDCIMEKLKLNHDKYKFCIYTLLLG